MYPFLSPGCLFRCLEAKLPSMESTMTSRSANGRRRICGPAKSAGHSVFENSAVGIALTDRDGFFAETNWAYEQLVGYTDKELRALSYSDITYEEDRPANRALAVALWEGKIPQFQYEKRYRRKGQQVGLGEDHGVAGCGHRHGTSIWHGNRSTYHRAQTGERAVAA